MTKRMENSSKRSQKKKKKSLDGSFNFGQKPNTTKKFKHIVGMDYKLLSVSCELFCCPWLGNSQYEMLLHYRAGGNMIAFFGFKTRRDVE